MSKSRDIADSAATINYIDNVTSDVQSQLNTLTTAIDNVSVTSGTLTKTFTQWRVLYNKPHKLSACASGQCD